MGASIGPWRGHLSMSQAKEVVVSAEAHVKLLPSSMQAEFETPGRQVFPTYAQRSPLLYEPDMSSEHIFKSILKLD